MNLLVFKPRNTRNTRKKTIIFVLFVLFVVSPCCRADDTWPRIDGPCSLVFPKDHSQHPDYKIEWWYYTGNLRTETGRHFGFQFTIFRARLSPPGEKENMPETPSNWRTDQLFLGHAAISDIDEGQFYHDRAAARGAAGLAGAEGKENRTEIFLKKWSAVIKPDTHQLKLKTKDFSINLDVTPVKAPVLQGDNGYSLKGSSPERASCYYSFTRLETKGSISIKEKTFNVSGSSWMDHEFSTSPLETGISGWDWFSLQLSDNTELMIYLLRKKDGTFHPASSGTFVDSKGDSRHISNTDIFVKSMHSWKSPHTKAVYPSGWEIIVKPADIRLNINSNLADQELADQGASGVVYWEGSVSFTGTSAGKKVAGDGYVELTGYAKPVDVLR